MKFGKYVVNIEWHPFDWLLWMSIRVPKPVYKNGVRLGRVMRVIKFRGPITISSEEPIEVKP